MGVGPAAPAVEGAVPASPGAAVVGFSLPAAPVPVVGALGPVAVDTHLQGTGIGSGLMRAFCGRMDAAGEVAYLETDKPINVRFYERFGFEVAGEEEVLGVPNWFMTRRATTEGGAR